MSDVFLVGDSLPNGTLQFTMIYLNNQFHKPCGIMACPLYNM